MIIELANGITLPYIPDDIVAQYPYIIVDKIESPEESFRMWVSMEPWFHYTYDTGFFGAAHGYITDYNYAAEYYIYPDGKTWTVSTVGTDSTPFRGRGWTAFEPHSMLWANHDIYDTETHNTEDMTFTPGTELYFEVPLVIKKFLGMEGLHQLITGIRSEIDDGTKGGVKESKTYTIKALSESYEEITADDIDTMFAN